MNLENKRIAIVGLGYVGLPLAIAFGNKFETIGFDINNDRILQLQNGDDCTNEVESQEISSSEKIAFTSDLQDISNCNIYIITVPTPIDRFNKPDLTALEKSSESIGTILKKDDIVIYESTVYPGLTEEICVPILASSSGLEPDQDFFYGYSPERINPGDKSHRLAEVIKITSGCNEEIAEIVDFLYKSIIKAGTYKTSSIKVAEAAKVIENIQRDVNIALVNDFAIIFDQLDLDTEEVLKAAATKWNFHSYFPGLVGGHCIGVDPYFLTFKADQIGLKPQMIIAGRKLNDYMSSYVANQTIKLMKNKNIVVENSRILIMGFTFKENCSDYRNTKVIDLYHELISAGCLIDIYDPWVDETGVEKDHGIKLVESPKNNHYDAVILAVAHKQFQQLNAEKIHDYCRKNHIIYDLKHILPRDQADGRL